MIDNRGPLTPGQLRTQAAREAALRRARNKRLDLAAAQLHAAGWTVLMSDGTRWTKPGDAR